MNEMNECYVFVATAAVTLDVFKSSAPLPWLSQKQDFLLARRG